MSYSHTPYSHTPSYIIQSYSQPSERLPLKARAGPAQGALALPLHSPAAVSFRSPAGARSGRESPVESPV